MPTPTFFNLPEAKRDRILEVSLEEFASNPYDRVSVAQIADKADIAKGSVYQYFEDKLDLYRHLLELASRAKTRYFSEHVSLGGEDLFEDLETLFRAGTAFARENPRYHRLAYRFMNSSVRDQILPDLRDMSEDFLRGMVESAHARRQIRSDVSADMAVYFVNTLLTEFGTYVLKHSEGNWEELAMESTGSIGGASWWGEMIEELIRMIRSGLADGSGRDGWEG